LLKLVRTLVKRIKRTIDPHLRFAAKREDAEISTTFGADFGNLRIQIMRLVRSGEVSPIVDQFGREILKGNTREMRRILRLDLAAETPEIQLILSGLRRQNVALIESIAEKLLGDVFRVVTESIIDGTRVETLASRLAERYSVSESRARLIARDQTLKANASLTETRHAQAGVTQYIWSSSRDERVRPTHADLDGSVFSWDDPPVTSEDGARNHPGEDFQCRCVAIPVVS
jgi:SPP1 gp7 family putative phage head morphogenesis protein